MGELYRKYADDLLSNCTDKKTGKLDLKMLKEETESCARHLAGESGSDYMHSETLSATAKECQNLLRQAINEVLGVIPKNKWSHDGENAKEPVLHNGLTVHYHGMQHIDPKNPYKTLEAEHITADRPIEAPKVQKSGAQAEKSITQRR